MPSYKRRYFSPFTLNLTIIQSSPYRTNPQYHEALPPNTDSGSSSHRRYCSQYTPTIRHRQLSRKHTKQRGRPSHERYQRCWRNGHSSIHTLQVNTHSSTPILTTSITRSITNTKETTEDSPRKHQPKLLILFKHGARIGMLLSKKMRS